MGSCVDVVLTDEVSRCVVGHNYAVSPVNSILVAIGCALERIHVVLSANILSRLYTYRLTISKVYFEKGIYK